MPQQVMIYDVVVYCETNYGGVIVCKFKMAISYARRRCLIDKEARNIVIDGEE